MKRLFFPVLTLVIVGGLAAPAAMANQDHVHSGQTNLKDMAADLNGDGEVTITELGQYNLDQRQA